MGIVLGFLTLVAMIASFITAVYGTETSVMRKHYGHSLSVMVVFAVWHHIFFSGALSLNWPSVLVAFWSNYAWAGGMIYSEYMQNVFNNFIGLNKGNTSQVGAAGTGEANPSLGGGYDIHQIYKRNNLTETLSARNPMSRRHLVDASSGFTYYGGPVRPGLPLPGNYSGFAGTLALQHIPASNAFLTGLLWFLILIATILVFTSLFILVLQILGNFHCIRRDTFAVLRSQCAAFTTVTLLRTLLIGFFMMTFLTMFQVSYLMAPGPVAIACIVFVGMVFGLGSAAAFAWYSKLDFGRDIFERDAFNVRRTRLMTVLPWCAVSRESKVPRSEDNAYVAFIPWFTIRSKSNVKSVHEDDKFTHKFGWLASRYRRSRWWFFIVWLAYEFIRACFLAGASTHPVVQVFGLLAVEATAFMGMILIRPFEGQRLNIVMVYLLGISKVATTALAALFEPRFGVPRIPATMIGIVIIVVQGLLTIVVMIAIVIGAITSYMSVTRDREVIRPAGLNSWRERYFKKMDCEARDVPPQQQPPQPPVKDLSKGPYFRVIRVERVAKVEDEDYEFMREIAVDSVRSHTSLFLEEGADMQASPEQQARAASLQSHGSHTSLPRAARLHRSSWSVQNYLDSQYSNRRRALSASTVATPIQPSVLEASKSETRFSPAGATDVASPSVRSSSRQTSRSHSSSKPDVKTIVEEDVPPLPETSMTGNPAK